MKEIFPPIRLYENILSIDECSIIKQKFFSYLNDEKSTNHDLENLENVFGVSVGIELNNLDRDICDRLSLLMEETYLKRLKYSNSFIRIYYNNSELPIHLDKSSLDVTLSVNIGGIENWPIHISTIKNRTHVNTGWFTDKTLIDKHKKEFLTFQTPLGSGVSCCGKVFPHWRDKLVCHDSEYVLQMFFHWRLI